MSHSAFLALLSPNYRPDERLEKLVLLLQQRFKCGAVVLLKLEGQVLKPIAATGLVKEAFGRHFITGQHPRLAALANSQSALRFPLGTPLPDPYDGLLDSLPGAALPIHDCMGMRLDYAGHGWGVITLDSLTLDTFANNQLNELEKLRPLLESVIRLSELEHELSTLKQSYLSGALSKQPLHFANKVIGQSAEIKQIKQELTIVANSDFPVLLMGETGVGKEVFANFVHQHSNRSERPMLHLNCAALPDELAESELFGHEKGAFTGASKERTGRLEAAHQGTLFLDEVGELSLAVQAKLLRVLQNGEIQRLGSDQVTHIDVRIIAATNRNLKEQVSEGTFRADLYHRLSVYPITIPPLREREVDIALFSGYFLELNRSRLGIRSLRLSADAELAIKHYAWPGNIRELEHTLSRGAIKALSRGANRHDIITLTAELLDLELPQSLSPMSHSEHSSELFDALEGLTMKEATKGFQRHLILHKLQQHQGSWSATARNLGVDPSNLHKLAQKLAIK